MNNIEIGDIVRVVGDMSIRRNHNITEHSSNIDCRLRGIDYNDKDYYYLVDLSYYYFNEESPDLHWTHRDDIRLRRKTNHLDDLKIKSLLTHKNTVIRDLIKEALNSQKEVTLQRRYEVNEFLVFCFYYDSYRYIEVIFKENEHGFIPTYLDVFNLHQAFPHTTVRYGAKKGSIKQNVRNIKWAKCLDNSSSILNYISRQFERWAEDDKNFAKTR